MGVGPDAYLWGSDTSVDVFVNDEPVIGGDLSFSGLIDKLDFAAQIHFEGRRGKGGFFLDTTYLDTGDSLITEGRPLLPDGTEVRTDTKTVMVEAGGTIRPGVRRMASTCCSAYALPIPI